MSKEYNVAQQIGAVAKALQNLGTADACTPMGALEHVAKELRDGLSEVACGLQSIAEAVREHGEYIAEAGEKQADAISALALDISSELGPGCKDVAAAIREKK